MKQIDNNNQSDEYTREEAYLRAKKRLKELKGFYWHAFVYAVVNILLLIVHVNHSDEGILHIGTFATPLFWGIGLAFHALGVFGKNLIFSKKWEQRKINEFMDRDSKQWK